MSTPIPNPPSDSQQSAGDLQSRLARSAVSAYSTASAAEAPEVLIGGAGADSVPVSPAAPTGWSGQPSPSAGSAVPPAPQPQQPAAPAGYGAPAYGAAPAPQAVYGQPTPAPQAQVPAMASAAPKSKVAAGLLGIFLGGLGIHNFYLGRTGRAVAQLLISILSLGYLAWVSWIWGVIEGIIILTAQPGAVPWGVDARGVPLRS